jgi:hypothetical protein
MAKKHQPWKDFERRFAKLMGGVRLWRPDYGDSIPDGESDTHTWDTKCYQRFSVVEMFQVNELKYRKFTGDRRFLLALFSREHRGAGDFVLLRAKDYAADQAELVKLREEIGNERA